MVSHGGSVLFNSDLADCDMRYDGKLNAATCCNQRIFTANRFRVFGPLSVFFRFYGNEFAAAFQNFCDAHFETFTSLP